MKKIHAEDGVKVNPVFLLNTVGDIAESNWREAIQNLFTPGVFIRKNEDGSLETDFSTTLTLPVTPLGTDYKSIRINISSTGFPSRAYTPAGKIITLYEPATVTPYTALGSPNIIANYSLYIKPKIVTTETVDYLPNYKEGDQTRDLVQEYFIDFQVVKAGTAGPEDAIKIATFSMDKNGILSNLVDVRSQNRAYLRRELYDFYSADLLKHNFIVTTGNTGVGQGTGKLTYNESKVLSGTLSLYSLKRANCKINVLFDGTVDYPTITFPNNNNYILYINVTLDDYYNAGVLTKALLYEDASTFYPDTNKIVLGVRVANAIPTDPGDPSLEEVAD